MCKPVGLAFLISDYGLFLTAKHVLTLRGKIKNPELFGVLFLKASETLIFNIRNILLHNNADIALGLLDDVNSRNFEYLLEYDKPNFCTSIPDEGEEISTCSFSDNPNYIYNANDLELNNEIKWANGFIRKYYPNGRDSYLLPGDCVEISMVLESGLSGGPVFNKNGQILGVNSTSFTGHDKDISYFTPILPIMNISFKVELPGKEIITNLQKIVKI